MTSEVKDKYSFEGNNCGRNCNASEVDSCKIDEMLRIFKIGKRIIDYLREIGATQRACRTGCNIRSWII